MSTKPLKVVIHSQNISDCSDCPFHNMEPDYSAEFFSTRRKKCMCNKLNHTVHRYIGTFDKMPVPDDCPLPNKL